MIRSELSAQLLNLDLQPLHPRTGNHAMRYVHLYQKFRSWPKTWMEQLVKMRFIMGAGVHFTQIKDAERYYRGMVLL